jgi:hypothetical protein
MCMQRNESGSARADAGGRTASPLAEPGRRSRCSQSGGTRTTQADAAITIRRNGRCASIGSKHRQQQGTPCGPMGAPVDAHVSLGVSPPAALFAPSGQALASATAWPVSRARSCSAASEASVPPPFRPPVAGPAKPRLRSQRASKPFYSSLR